jgi:hypothetical protein
VSAPRRRIGPAVLACAGAMALGLWADTRAVSAEALAAVCGTASSLAEAWTLHWRVMPWSTALAAALPLLPWLMPRWPARIEASLCAAAMALGMLLALPWAAPIGRWSGASGLASMLAAMAAGMLAGALAAHAVCALVAPDGVCRAVAGRGWP